MEENRRLSEPNVSLQAKSPSQPPIQFRHSCPAQFDIPWTDEIRLIRRAWRRRKRKKKRKARNLRLKEYREKLRKIPKAPNEPNFNKSELKVKRGFGRKLQILEARGIQEVFRSYYYSLRRPFRRNQEFRRWNEFISAFIFGILNVLPPLIFVYVILLDCLFLRNLQSDEERSVWVNYLWCFTKTFVICYCINLIRLGYVFFRGAHGWLDFESILYQPILRVFWKSLKWFVEWIWETYHNKTWKFIRGIQAQTRERGDLVHALAGQRNLPPRVEGLIGAFLTVQGVNELDYRWFLHDNRRKMRHLRKLDYKTRECIASFVIPEPAFKMNKDALVNLYCSEL